MTDKQQEPSPSAGTRNHWEKTYTEKSEKAVSWYQEHADMSLAFIARTGSPPHARIIDIGGGASTLVDGLLSARFTNVTVLDLSASALQTARNRLGSRAAEVNWIVGDITDIQLPEGYFDVWHDRAVFHFLVTPEARAAYKKTLLDSLKPGGHVILATFAEDGPLRCSGLPVQRYSVPELNAELGPHFKLAHFEREQHTTPVGAIQSFNYCYFTRSDSQPGEYS